MKRTSAIFYSLFIAGAIILLSSCSGDKKPSDKATEVRKEEVSSGSGTGRIAWVDIDTLNANYEIVKQKQEEFKKKGAAIEAEMETSARRFQKDYNDFMQKAQSGGFTSQAEGEAAQKRLQQMQETFEKRKEVLADELLNEQETFNKEVKRRLDAFLEEYNKDKKYDYIFSYKEGDPIMFRSKELDITWDVVNGMNKTQGQPIETTKKK